TGRYCCATHQARFPANACPEQELGVPRQQFQDLHHFEVKNVSDRVDDLVEEFLQVAFGECVLTQSCERLLLARTHAHFPIDVQAFGHLTAHAEHLHRGAIFDED